MGKKGEIDVSENSNMKPIRYRLNFLFSIEGNS